ncbi:GNAT family N-acetyltransferase [Halorubellus salinus]|uniref:GNAT family N-acetyltransferase n=1 Tax=Halorubellus salinus TaxID=755309 RepID=UPI001D085F38|nr:GNAT family N-acetyltransferase [Halorubellus salinus]
MELTGKLEFDHADREAIYDYVESHGTVRYEKLRKSVGLDERAFGHHIAILKRNGVLEEPDRDHLGIAYESGAEEEYESGEVAFTIRQAREEDLTGLVGAMRRTVEGGDYVEAESVAHILEEEGVLLRRNELETRMFFVACVDNEVVGWVHIDHPEVEKLSHTAELTVGVLEEYREHGIGSHLLERGVEWAGSRGYERLYNSVPATNEAAIEFLEGQGWQTEAVRDDHYKIADAYVDEVMMARHLV